MSEGVSFWDAPVLHNAASPLPVRLTGRVPLFHLNQASPLSLASARSSNGAVEVLAIGARGQWGVRIHACVCLWLCVGGSRGVECVLYTALLVRPWEALARASGHT
jgi:hypothetical protein